MGFGKFVESLFCCVVCIIWIGYVVIFNLRFILGGFDVVVLILPVMCCCFADFDFSFELCGLSIVCWICTLCTAGCYWLHSVCLGFGDCLLVCYCVGHLFMLVICGWRVGSWICSCWAVALGRSIGVTCCLRLFLVIVFGVCALVMCAYLSLICGLIGFMHLRFELIVVYP